MPDEDTGLTEAQRKAVARLTAPRPDTSAWKAAADSESAARRDAVLAELARDRAALAAWFDEELEPIEALGAAAAEVQEAAQDLAVDPAGQGPARRELIRVLWTKRLALIAADEGARDKIDLDDRPEDLSPFASLLVDRRGKFTYQDDDALARQRRTWPVEHMETLDKAREDLEGYVVARLEGHKEALDAARELRDDARQSVWNARRMSAARFARPPVVISRAGRYAAALPLAVFLVVAAIGTVASATPGVIWAAGGALIVASAVSIVVGLRERVRGVWLAGIGGGSSLAVFTALYLASFASNATTVQLGCCGLQPVAEASLLSLTIGLAVGPMGIDLSESGRVIAFVQLLFTVVAIATAVSWGWRSMIDRVDAPRPPSASGEEPG